MAWEWGMHARFAVFKTNHTLTTGKKPSSMTRIVTCECALNLLAHKVFDLLLNETSDVVLLFFVEVVCNITS